MGKSLKIGFLFLLLTSASFSLVKAQSDFYFTPAYGIGFSKGRLNKLQESYTSYQTYISTNFPGDPFVADPNWDTKSTVQALSFHAGMSRDGYMGGMSFFPYRLKQERNIMQESGYGRKFIWQENRNELFFDLGYGSKIIDVFGSFGVNFNTYKMRSYQVYPSGALSINNEFYFNGLYSVFDAGISFGAGIKVKVIPFLAIEFRYIYAGTMLPGERNSIIEDPTALSDDSFSRIPGTNHYPQDYMQPITLDNEINPDFQRSTIQFSVLFYYRHND